MPTLPPPLPPDAFDDDDDARPDGSPDDLRDEGPLESLGKAVTSPVTGAAEPDEQALGRTEDPAKHKPA